MAEQDRDQEMVEGFRLSPQQARLWTLGQAAGHGGFRTEGVLAFEGAFDPDRLRAAWTRVVAGHEILRTGFRHVPGMALPLQVIAPAAEATVLLEERGDAEPSRGPDPAAGWAVRVTLTGAGDRPLLWIEGPSLMLDAPSLRLLVGEIARAYARNPSEPAVQYADVAEWSHERLTMQDEDGAAARGHWLGARVPDLATLRLPGETPAAATTFAPTHLAVRVPAPLLDQAARAAEVACVSLPGFLLACWQTVLSRLTDRARIAVGVVHGGRGHPDLAQCLGPLARHLPLAGDLSAGRPFAELAAELDAGLRAADRWHDRYSPADAELPYCFEYQDPVLPAIAPGLTISLIRATAQADRYRVKLVCAPSPGPLRLELHYDAGRYAAEDIRRLAGCLAAAIGSAAAEPRAALGDLDILAPDERHRVLRQFNPAPAPRDDVAPVHRMVEEQAARTPDRTALVCAGERVSYGELDRRAGELAGQLVALGAGPDRVVGAYLPRAPDMVAAILAVLKAGGAWLPLDPSSPPDRVGFMLRDAGACAVITRRALRDQLPSGDFAVVLTDPGGSAVGPAGAASAPWSPAQLAYVIYTSGSTGRPKGVMATQGSLAGYVRALRAPLGLTPDDVYLHTATFAFSSSVRQLFAPLTVGATVVLATHEQIAEPPLLFETIRREGVTIVDLVPSYLRACLAALEAMPFAPRGALLANRLRLVLTASEPLPAEEPRRWAGNLGQAAAMVNMFGQTETTGIVTLHPVRPGDGEGTGIVPVGRPLETMRLYILDPRGRPVPTGTVGEIYLGGEGLARGYVGGAGPTAERFLPDPFALEPGSRLYRTGDLGRHRPDGTVEFVGRRDHQIKVRGFRVEPGEIELVLRKHPRIAAATVVARPDAAGQRSLVAFLVADGPPPDPAELLRAVRERLPDYMVPSALVFLDALPLTATGKLDRRALREREIVRPSSAASAPPRTPTEEALAAIWAEVLGVERVGVHDDFFELGGHSLLATQIIARIGRALGLRVPLTILFDRPTIAELAAEVDRKAAPMPAGQG